METASIEFTRNSGVTPIFLALIGPVSDGPENREAVEHIATSADLLSNSVEHSSMLVELVIGVRAAPGVKINFLRGRCSSRGTRGTR
jgi:hypothetical protein